jgi:hypothetical protein
VAIGLVALTAVVAVVWPREREPEYAGIRLSEWLRYQHQGAFFFEGRGIADGNGRVQEPWLAVRQMGTNSFPWLLKWMKFERSTLRDKLFVAFKKLPQRFQLTAVASALDQDPLEIRANDATMALIMFGSAAWRVVPELKMMSSTPGIGGKRPELANRAGCALVIIEGVRPGVGLDISDEVNGEFGIPLPLPLPERNRF